MSSTFTIPDLVAQRTDVNIYTARSASGAEVRIGGLGEEGVFSPVELLQAALAGCAALSAEAQFTSDLGPNFDATSTVEAVLNMDENRVEKLITTIATDTSELSPEKHDKLIASAERIIDKLCTVKRSLSAGIEPVTTVTSKE